MAEYPINPKHNVFKKYRTVNYINSYIFIPEVTYNTYIGGVSATIGTAALLATKLGISTGAISNFTVVGSDIKCKITGSYAIPSNAFDKNNGFPNVLTYYYDNDNLVIHLNQNAFYFQSNFIDFKLNGVLTFSNNGMLGTNLKNYYFPNLISIENYAFGIGGSICEIVYIPRCTAIGSSSSVNNYNFANIKIGTIIYAHQSMATINGGGVEADLAAAIAAGNIVRYVTNFTAPLKPTATAIGTIYNTAIQLIDPFTSVNAIDYYEVSINGGATIKLNVGSCITGLNTSTSYNITLIAVDVFYNKSSVSNSLSVTTNTIDYEPYNYINASGNMAYETAIVNLFSSLKSNNLYNKIQAFYPFLGTTAAQHKWNAKNPLDTNLAFRLTFFGTGTFSNLGYQCNGTNAYANTYFNSRTNQSINNNGMTLVSGTNNVKNDSIEIGCYTGGNDYNFLNVKRYTSNGERGFISAGIGVSQTGVFEARGIFTGSKTTQNNAKLYRNGTTIATTTTGNIGTLCNLNNYIGVLNNNGSPYAYSPQRIQFTAIHEGLSDAEASTLHTIIDTFETAIGRKTW